jgi:hypothetical protein
MITSKLVGALALAMLVGGCAKPHFERDPSHDEKCGDRFRNPMLQDKEAFVPMHNGSTPSRAPMAFTVKPKDDSDFARRFECSWVGEPYCCNAVRNATTNEWEPLPK